MFINILQIFLQFLKTITSYFMTMRAAITE